jgi:hypothetical protein
VTGKTEQEREELRITHRKNVSEENRKEEDEGT